MTTHESEEEIAAYAGDQVIVAVSSAGYARRGHWPQMSIHGTLEHLPGSNAFRVVVSESTYTYFNTENVYLINPLAGPCVILHVRIDTPADAHL